MNSLKTLVIISSIFAATAFLPSCGLKFKKLQATETQEKDLVAELMEEGNLLYQQEKYTEALAKFLEAKSIDNKRLLVHYNIGACYFSLENYAGAALAFTDEIALNPRDAFSYIFRGHTYAMMNLNDKATQDIELSLQITDHAMSYYVQGLIHLNKKEFDLATNKFNIAIYKNPADYMFYRERGKAYAALNKMEKACADFEQAKRISPKLDLSEEMQHCE